MDLHSKMTMYITSKMTSPVTKTAKMSKWLRLESTFFSGWRKVVDQKKNPSLKNHIFEPLLYTFLEKWLQIKWLCACLNVYVV